MPTRNEFGVKLDKNGYAPSLFLHDSFRCYRCGCFGDTARHEIYGGSRRKASKALGLWINVCPDCHIAIQSVSCKTTTTNRASFWQKPTTTGTTTTFAAVSIKTIWRTNLC